MTDLERIRLAKLGQKLGRKALAGVAAIVRPDTILEWFRRLVAKKYTANTGGRAGRPSIAPELEDLILALANANRTWGYDRIVGALKNLGHDVSDETVGNVLRRHGIPPVGARKPKVSWADFIASHKDTLAAADFFTVEVITPVGLICLYVLFFIHLGTRQVQIAGVTAHPTEAWMLRVAKEVTMDDWGLLKVHGCTRLIIDRDDKFSAAFRGFMRSSGVEPLLLPARSPNLNAFAERWVLSVKSECLSHLVFFSESSVRKALNEYLAHYHFERNHQGVGNTLLVRQPDENEKPGLLDDRPTPACEDEGLGVGDIVCRERLGGLLRFYYRKSA